MKHESGVGGGCGGGEEVEYILTETAQGALATIGL